MKVKVTLFHISDVVITILIQFSIFSICALLCCIKAKKLIKFTKEGRRKLYVQTYISSTCACPYMLDEALILLFYIVVLLIRNDTNPNLHLEYVGALVLDEGKEVVKGEALRTLAAGDCVRRS